MSAEKKKAKKRAEKVDTKGHRSNVLGIGLAITVLVALISIFDGFEVLEYRSVDLRFAARGPREMTVPAVIVAVGDEDLNGWIDPVTGNSRYLPERWPFPRDFWATGIDNLSAAGAKIIAFDIVYSESSKRDPKQDQLFAQAAKRAGNVVFAERYVIKENLSIKTETLITPLDRAKRDKGHIVPEMSPGNYIRAYRPLYYSSTGEPDPEKVGLDLAVLRQFLFGKAMPVTYEPKEDLVKLGEISIPLNHRGSVDINYAGPPGTVVPHVPFHEVYYKTADMSQFKGKVVYVGSTTEILRDNFRAPFATSGRQMPGVETHVHFLDTLLSQQFIRSFPRWVELLLILCMGVLVSTLTFRVRAVMGITVTLVLIGAYVTLVFVAFIDRNVLIPLVAPFSSMLLSFAGIAVYRGAVDEKKARTTRQLFSRYVSKSIVEEIMRNPGAVSLGGEEKETTILFSDVRGFTSMSERLSAPEVVEVLNEYLTAMVDVVIANHGTLDKYVGDAIMAVWGSPLPDPDQKSNAIRTAVQMMEVLEVLKAKWVAEGKVPLDIGIGLNSGRVVAGNMGHPDFKMDYTVIGDDVNLAARMESANKEMKSHVLITGSTLEGCEHLIDVIHHPPIHVKGKANEVEVYEVIGWKGQGRAPWARPLQ